jgi:hypothetical protein
MPISDKYRELRGDYLFHYTHQNNVNTIKNHYTIFSHENLTIKGIQAEHITNNSSRLIDKRLGYNKYVFLVFSESHPFIYKQKINGIPIMCISIDISILDVPGVLIADRVATDNLVTLYTPEEALDLLKIDYCHTGRINDKDIWNEVKKYEILIPGNIDLHQYLYKK